MSSKIHSRSKSLPKLLLLGPIRELYSEPSQTQKIELFAKIINNRKLLIIFAKSLILNV